MSFFSSSTSSPFSPSSFSPPSSSSSSNEVVSKCQQEIRRLKDLNQQLVMQHEHSEETLKEYQDRTSKLQHKLDE